MSYTLDESKRAEAPTSVTLSRASRELLQCCCELETVNTERLASHLHLAPASVASRFKRINEQLGTHSREEALLRALRRGWVTVTGETATR